MGLGIQQRPLQQPQIRERKISPKFFFGGGVRKTGWFPKGGFGGCSPAPQNSERGYKKWHESTNNQNESTKKRNDGSKNRNEGGYIHTEEQRGIGERGDGPENFSARSSQFRMGNPIPKFSENL